MRGDNGVSLYINGNYIAYNHNGAYEGQIGGNSPTRLTINNPFFYGNNSINCIVHEDDVVSSLNWTSYFLEITYNYF